MEPHLLLKRLEDIGHALEKSQHALALVGLGSVGLELERLDSFSDLDFFVLVEPGYKQAYLDDLRWMSSLCPIAYCFANTRDGYKLLFADHIFCEFVVFEPQELKEIPFAPGRVVWKREDVPASVSQPALLPGSRQEHTLDWLLGEALTNLIVGLAREKRGEKLSAMRFIQGYAVDRILELANSIEVAQGVSEDAFTNERRFERRHPGVASKIPAFLQGYERNRESALAILTFLEQHYPVNQEVAGFIRELCA